MGWKGALRSIQAASRAADRDAKRRQRELERRRKEYARLEELEQAALEVDEYENFLERLTSLHRELSAAHVNWDEIAEQPAPTEPVNERTRESKARRKLEEFKPNFLNTLFSSEDKKRANLESRILIAVEKDHIEYDKRKAKFDVEFNEWKTETNLAFGVIENDPESLIAAVGQFHPFAEISGIGSELNFSANPETRNFSVTLKVHGKDIIPERKKSLLQSGKLSVKAMGKGEFNELHQDYVCSCCLRVLRELFTIIPVEEIYLTATDDILNKKTGHIEEQPILSLMAPRQTLESLNMLRIDPSDSMDNFVHNMNFKKTTGFEPVAKLESSSLSSKD